MYYHNGKATYSIWIVEDEAENYNLYYKDGTPFTQLTFATLGDAQDYGLQNGYAVSLYIN